MSFTDKLDELMAEKGINKETCDELLENIRQCYRDMAQKYGADFPGKMKD